jgi:hypothetical protein
MYAMAENIYPNVVEYFYGRTTLITIKYDDGHNGNAERY